MNVFTFDLNSSLSAIQITDGDPVNDFFRRMPSSDKDAPTSLTPETSQLVQNACQLLATELMFRESTDPDHQYLQHHINKAHREPVPAQYVFQQLVMLAFTKGVADDDDSHKARYLRFCRWIAQGRKDETAHFGPVSGTLPVVGVSKPVLPESSTVGRCAECGENDATMQCSGCLIRTDNHTTFATSYCSKECQVQHWKKHRALCRQMQQIARAMALFQDIFEHFLSLTFPGAHLPKEITEQNGMVVVRYKNSSVDPQTQGPVLSRFPLELASSPDIARAALTHSRCWEALSRARTLFEMLIRPLCAKIQDIAFDPKNMHKPVHITHADWDEHNALMGHEIFLVTLHCGKTMVLDPTGIQFGWKEHIAPWEAYKTHRVHHITQTKNLGSDTPGIQDPAANPEVALLTMMAGVPTEMNSRDCREQLLMETVVTSLKSQINTRFGGVTDFLRLKGSEFDTARAGVLAAAKRGLTMLAGEINNGAQARIIQQPGGAREIIWVKGTLANVGNGQSQKLKRLWKARWDKVVDITLATAEAE